MRKYLVTKQCYVPVGTGKKYKKPGQVVSLAADDAAELSDYVKLIPEVAGPITFAKVEPAVAADTEGATPKKAKRQKVEDEPAEEVVDDAGEPEAAVQRAGTETVE